MNQYRGIDGVVVEVCVLTAPTVINTVGGEEVGEAGQYLVCPPGCKPQIMDAADFAATFTVVPPP